MFLAAAACALDKAVAVGAFGDGGVVLMCAHVDRAEGAVIFGDHIVLALRNRTFDAVVLLFVFHN